MDKEQGGKKENRFGWLPQYMPGVARLIGEKRAKHGDAWVNECWKRGVLQLEPGWFFAMEGPLAVGVMWQDPVIYEFSCRRHSRTQALLILPDPPAAGAQPQPVERPHGAQA